MMNTKVTTAIVNAAKQALTMKVGSQHCYPNLTSSKVGASEYRLQLDVNWTYKEFVAQDKGNTANRVFLNSDDCCDCERITVRSKQPCSAIVEEDKESKKPAEEQMAGNVMSTCKAWVFRFSFLV